MVGMALLEEPEFFHGDNCVSTGVFETGVFDQLFHIHDVTLRTMRPPEESNEIVEGFGEYSHGIPYCSYIKRTISFAELGTVFISEETDVPNLWGFPAKGIVYGEMFWC